MGARRKAERANPAAVESPLSVVVFSGSCCVPGMAPLDERVQQLVVTAAAETAVQVQLTVLPVTSALLGVASPPLLARLVADFNESGRIGLPAVLVEGEPVGTGLPTLEQLKTALGQARDASALAKGAAS